MKRMIVAMMTLIVCASYAKEHAVWRHDGIYIVNKSEGYLTIEWQGHKEQPLEPASKILIPVTKPGVTIKIYYNNKGPAYLDMPSCKGGAHVSFTTRENIKLYEIRGGHEEGRGAFNRPGTGPHCNIKLHHQGFPADHAIEQYPDLK